MFKYFNLFMDVEKNGLDVFDPGRSTPDPGDVRKSIHQGGICQGV